MKGGRDGNSRSEDGTFLTQPQARTGEFCGGKIPQAKARPKGRGERQERGLRGQFEKDQSSHKHLNVFIVAFVAVATGVTRVAPFHGKFVGVDKGKESVLLP